MVVVFCVWSLSANAPQPGDRVAEEECAGEEGVNWVTNQLNQKKSSVREERRPQRSGRAVLVEAKYRTLINAFSPVILVPGAVRAIGAAREIAELEQGVLEHDLSR